MAAKEDVELEELIRGAGGETEQGEEDGSGLDLTTLLMVARKSLPWVILLIGLGLTGAWLFLRYTPPIYRSSSILKIDEKTEAGVLGLEGIGGAVEKQQNLGKLSGEVELIKSDLIYRRLKDSLMLDVNYYAEGTVLERELYRISPFKVTYAARNSSQFNTRFGVTFLDDQRLNLVYDLGGQEQTQEVRFNQPIQTSGFTLTITKTGLFGSETVEGKYYFVINDGGAINAYLNANLTVAIENPDANTINISFTDKTPIKAQDIVNKVDTVYLVEKILKKQEQAARTLQFIDSELSKNNGDLGKAEADIQTFAERNQAFDVKGELTTIASTIADQEIERQKLQEKVKLLAEIRSTVDNDRIVGREDADVVQAIPGLSDLGDSQLPQLLQQFNEQQLDLQQVLRSYQPTTTAVKLRQASLSFTKKTLQDLMLQTQTVLQKQLNLMNQQRQQLDAKLQTLPQKFTEQERLRRPLELLQRYNGLLMDRKMSYGIAKAGTTPDFQILSPASGPTAPISPIRIMAYAIGLAGGFALGIGLIAVRYLMHNTVTNIRELEQGTSATVLGVIPTYDREKMAVSKLVVDKNPKSAISEAIRSIRTNLEFIASSKKKRLISVTSTISGEGKTFVTVNLAAIIASSEQRVVVLDLDMRKPKVNLAFNAENVKGVSTILIERHTWAECVQHTAIPTLDFISAGPTPPNPSELILSPKFDEMLTELYQHYDVVMIDTPPVGLVTDGILIMRKADVPIYIVRANYSKKTFLKNINKLVRANGFTRLTTILNDAKASGMSGYGYGYGYGYGQGYYEDNQARPSLMGRLRKRISS